MNHALLLLLFIPYIPDSTTCLPVNSTINKRPSLKLPNSLQSEVFRSGFPIPPDSQTDTPQARAICALSNGDHPLNGAKTHDHGQALGRIARISRSNGIFPSLKKTEIRHHGTYLGSSLGVGKAAERDSDTSLSEPAPREREQDYQTPKAQPSSCVPRGEIDG